MSHYLVLSALCLIASNLCAEELGMDRSAAETYLASAWEKRVAYLKSERADEMEKKIIVRGDLKMPWLEKVFGDAPADGHSLYISMHGGGQGPKTLNDSQWQNQIRLYEPAEGIYVAPRAPTDTWNLWHEGHIDPMFDRLIENYIALRGVNPNRVYLMGYSAGGDGVWQLAPRMADRFAAASMMAGHPNESSILPLRNLPIALFVGGEDAAFNRNKIVAQRGLDLDKLQKEDAGGYDHICRVYPGLPHWMDRKDAEAVPWMAGKTRQPWPKKIVWLQDDITHSRFYWLAISPDDAKKDAQITAEVVGQTISLTGDIPASLTLRLSDALLDLDQTVTVKVGDTTRFAGKVPRSHEAIDTSLNERADPKSAASALLTLPK